MNQNHAGTSLDDLDVEPSSEEILEDLERLLQWYCREPSPPLATIIVARLEALRESFGDTGGVVPEWSCPRLIRSWEYLAARCRGD